MARSFVVSRVRFIGQLRHFITDERNNTCEITLINGIDLLWLFPIHPPSALIHKSPFTCLSLYVSIE